MKTSFISCARSSWLQRASALILALAPLAGAQAAPAEKTRGGDIEQAWFRLAQGLSQPSPEFVKERTDELLYAAGKSDLKRMTPLALALVAQARIVSPVQGEALLVQATRLDPGSPEAWLALAENELRRVNLFSGCSSLGRGLLALFADRRLRSFVESSALLAGLTALLAAFALWAVVAIRRVLPRVWHDLNEIGAHWRLGSNSAVLAVLIVALPLFAGGDPIWLGLWVFVLGWAYLPAGQRVVGVLGLALLAASPTLVELSFRALSHPPSAVIQATEILRDQRYEPQILEELDAVADVFGDDADFRRLAGDCYRQFNLLDQAVLSYREGLRIAPHDSALSLSLGTVHYLEGDYNAALQAFQSARDNGYDPFVANYNLSLTYAQTYHFRESEDAMAVARHAGDRQLQTVSRGRERDILTPRFRRDEAVRMVGRKDTMLLLNRGLVPPPIARERTVLHPLTIGGLCALFLAAIHLLARLNSGGLAAACLKCGRAFCRRCKLSHESQSYCTQCINIFLKKDMVGLEAQLAKRQQLARRQSWLKVERRIADLLLPGIGVAWGGRPILGSLLAVLAVVSAASAFIWLPAFVSPALMTLPMWPLEAFFGSVWAAAALVAQLLPGEWR